MGETTLPGRLPEGLGTGEPRAGFPDLQSQFSLFGLLPPSVSANPPLTHKKHKELRGDVRIVMHHFSPPRPWRGLPILSPCTAVRIYSRSGLVLLCVCGDGH